MNKTHKLASTVIIGIIVIGITVAIFFLGTVNPRVSLDWQSFLFVILSELLLFGTLIYLTTSATPSNKGIIRAGILSTITIYWVISVVLALLRHLFAEHQNTFVVVNIILMGITIILSILLNMVASKVQSIDSKTINERLFWQGIEQRSYALASNGEYSEFKQGLNLLYENVKFSDKVGGSTYDKGILDEMVNLEMALCNNVDSKKEIIEKTISQIQFFVKQRNMELSQSKKGGF